MFNGIAMEHGWAELDGEIVNPTWVDGGFREFYAEAERLTSEQAQDTLEHCEFGFLLPPTDQPSS